MYSREIDKDIENVEMIRKKEYIVVNLEMEIPKGYEILVNQKDFFEIVSHEEIKSLVFGNKNLISKLYSQTEHYPYNVGYQINGEGESSILIQINQEFYYFVLKKLEIQLKF